MIRRRTARNWGLLCLLPALSCSPKDQDSKSERDTASPAPLTGAAQATEVSTPAPPVDAGIELRDWQCPVVATAPRGGRFGDKQIKRRAKKHAGLTKVVLRANSSGVLHLAALAEDDAENDRGVASNQASPPRGVQAYRYQNESWEDLGRPAQLIGWSTTLEGAIGEHPAYAVSASIGDVRQAVIASCEAGRWKKQTRFGGESYEAAALLVMEKTNTLENLSILRGAFSEVSEGCKPTGPFGGGKVPVSLRLPGGYGDAAETSMHFAGPGECRLPRKWVTDALGDAVSVAYEQCESQWGGDHVSIVNCQIATLWFLEGGWKRLPAIAKLGAYEFETRHALALGSAGPLLAVTGADGLALHQAGPDGWNALPPLPGGQACRLPIRLRSDPPRVVTRTCASHGQVNAYYLEKDQWIAVGSSFALEPQWGAQERPSIAAEWIDQVPYLAVGYYGAPVARVFEGKGKRWQQILEAVVDPTPGR